MKQRNLTLIQINFDLIQRDEWEGYILEVDLIYLKYVHEVHNKYPLEREKVKLKKACHQVIARKVTII